MRLVLDTNVVVSGLLWDGSPRQLLQLGRGERVRLFTSAPLLAELTEVLLRPKFEQKLQRHCFLSIRLLIFMPSWLLWCSLRRCRVPHPTLMTM
jgi:putative PIN family toxin of toxin-antitoxin system